MERIARLLPPVALLLAVAACRVAPGPEVVPEIAPVGPEPLSVPAVLSDAWELSTVFRGDTRINGVACGELDPSSPGDEIVAVDRRGAVRAFRRSGEGFEPMDFRPAGGASMGELVQVICADLLPSVPGDEIVAVGMFEGGEDDGGRGIVRVFARLPWGDGEGWMGASLVTPGLVHAVAAGDLDPSRPGLEVVVAGYFGEARLLGVTLTDQWYAVEDLSGAHELGHEGNAKGACLTAGGFALACDDGGLSEFTRGDDGALSIHGRRDLGAALARIAPFPGDGVVVCDNGGMLRVIERGAGGQLNGAVTGLERADNRLRGAVVADLVPGDEGVEVATAGYDGVIRVVTLENVEIRSMDHPNRAARSGLMSSKRSVARDSAKLHHLTTGEIDGLGLCLVSCGYSGSVLVVHRVEARRAPMTSQEP